MKISRLPIWLTMAIVVLVLLASGTGLFLPGVYARETVSWRAQTLGQDIANIVAAVTLLIVAYFVNRGSIKAFLIWIGVLLTLIYAYIIYAFDIHFNSLFLVYVAILGLSIYALVGSMIHLYLDRLQAYFSVVTRVRLVSMFLLLLALLFSFQWLSEDIPALATGKLPQSILQANLPTNPVHVLDLGLYLPTMIITAILLWRKKLLGYLLTVPLLVFSILTGMGILAAFLVMGSKGMPTSLGVELFFAIIVMASLILSVLFLREVK